MTRTTTLLLIFLLLTIFLFISLFAFTLKYIDLAHTFHHYQQTRHPHIESIEADRLRRQMEIEQDVKRLLEIFGDVREFETTAYAPLDPNAIEGMCYSGDPNVTASGGRPIPGETVAAGPGIPFGSRVWIEGIGFRTVNDRGGRITDNHLDIVVASRKEAFAWGRQTVRAVILL